MESREYFEKVMQDYNQNRNGRSLRKYCKDEAVDYNWLMEFKKTYSASKPQFHQPVQSFIPLSLEEETPKQTTWEVKILHYDLNGYVLYQKWFDNGKFLKPEFTKMQRSHEISRETLILLLSAAIQTKIAI